MAPQHDGPASPLFEALPFRGTAPFGALVGRGGITGHAELGGSGAEGPVHGLGDSLFW